MLSKTTLISPILYLVHAPRSSSLFDIHLSEPLKQSKKPFKKPKHSSSSSSSRRSTLEAQIFQCFSASCDISVTSPDDILASSSDTIDYFSDYTDIGSLIHGCSSVKEVKRLHSVVSMYKGSSRLFLDNNLISRYAGMGYLTDARRVFDEMPERNVVSWTAMVSGYLRFGFVDEALRMSVVFVECGFRANHKTLVCLLNLCSKRLDSELGKQVHGWVIKGNFRNLIVESAVINFYAQCGLLEEAFRLFDRMQERDVVCWTTIITACSQHGESKKAIDLLSQMLSDGFAPNEFTVCSVLKACGEAKALRFGRQLHGSIVKKIFRNDVFLGTSLVDMYAKCGEIKDSRIAFNGMRRRNMVTWTSIIAGYARNGHGEEAITLFRAMRRRKIHVNMLTIVSIIRACGLLRVLQTGKEVHAQILKSLVQDNMYLGSALVWLYCKCGDYSSANYVLQRMTSRDVVSWTAMISGCARLGHESEAIEFLKEMLGEGVIPNPFTYSSVLKACSKLENVWHGKSIHSSINKTHALSNVFVGSALINMYAKCGYIKEAVEVFDSMPEKNLVSWKAMILGYAKNGFCREAMKLLYQMQAEGMEVDDYIFSTVVTACGDFGWNAEDHPSLYSLQSDRSVI